VADIIKVCKVSGENNEKAEQPCGMRESKYSNHFIMIYDEYGMIWYDTIYDIILYMI